MARVQWRMRPMLPGGDGRKALTLLRPLSARGMNFELSFRERGGHIVGVREWGWVSAIVPFFCLLVFGIPAGWYVGVEYLDCRGGLGFDWRTDVAVLLAIALGGLCLGTWRLLGWTELRFDETSGEIIIRRGRGPLVRERRAPASSASLRVHRVSMGGSGPYNTRGPGLCTGLLLHCSEGVVALAIWKGDEGARERIDRYLRAQPKAVRRLQRGEGCRLQYSVLAYF